jgi:hypothetical protein
VAKLSAAPDVVLKKTCGRVTGRASSLLRSCRERPPLDGCQSIVVRSRRSSRLPEWEIVAAWQKVDEYGGERGQPGEEECNQ